MNEAIVAGFYARDLRRPFYRDPWEILTDLTSGATVDFQAALVQAHGESMLCRFGIPPAATEQAAIQSLVACSRELDRILNEKHKRDGKAPPLIYSVHPKSVICRIVGRWATMHGVQNSFPMTAQFVDLCEVLNYPAMMTVEERFAFSPYRLSIIANVEITSADVTQAILCPTIRHFLK